ncbi:MAG: ATP-dependent DNA helicase [Candidatus Magasanikbacteria bacterium CG10_big_fil_rev_8_21_14_0_10_36_32]|uniref:DNA 3'-5' helicase n=1 Tax=Candidatus Magasanikbacteria bacterium CG10_big_fil_rev_8_21_14_0_10_36_32 TaxID=1974646 RepID=A0A2M6W6V7_9BACT|nr:MAG: ATP-dependent DNA helicase [Candidatus Magasanikbacteria bacterium CG10_big_fil_rev_8_21_14_0_10_36_32]
MIDFPTELNQEQLAVVYQGDGPCLVLAGAGSGKTRVVTYRVAYLLEKGISEDKILLLTFTNKASAEMVNRVKNLTGRDSRLPWAGTFHSIAHKILRKYSSLLDYKNNFTILDEDDSESLLKICVKNCKDTTVEKKFPSIGAIKNIISFSRNAELPLSDVVDLKYPNWFEYVPVLEKIACEYSKSKKEANAMDFDDLLVNLLLLLQNPEICRRLSEQFQYILVDEYQDTNRLQSSIIKKLSSVHNNVLVVGDDAQSIYSFRAADVKNILNFECDYLGAKVFKLETNYRSYQTVLDVANSIISKNLKQYKKVLKTILFGGAKPLLKPHLDQSSEAKFIAGEIEKKLKAGTATSEIAVLFRAAYHSQQLEMELVRRGIGYDYRGGLRFFERAHIKDVLAYLRLRHNPSDTSAWLRVLLHEEGIGPAGAMKIISMSTGAANIDELKQIGESLGDRATGGWQNFLNIYSALMSSEKKPSDMIEVVVESPYADYLSSEYLDAAERLSDLKQLIIFAKQHDSLDDFLAEAALAENFALKNGKRVVSSDRIILSTLHQAKGLEWKNVFIMNVARGAFPNDRALREDGGLEEERRLFYVGITRAKENLYLTYPMSGGSFGDSLTGPSVFLEEISPDLLEDHSLLISNHNTSFNDSEAGVSYISEEEEFQPKKISPGSFLRDIDDL